MSFKMKGRLVGKIKSELEAISKDGYTYHTFQVTTTEKWYDKKNKEASHQPVTIFVSLQGNLTDKMKTRMTVGSTIIAEGEVERTVAEKDGSAIKVQKGDRAGDFLYNTTIRVNTSDLDFPPATIADVTAAGEQTRPENKATPEPVKTNSNTSMDKDWI